MKKLYLIGLIIVFICYKKSHTAFSGSNASFINFSFFDSSIPIDSTLINNKNNALLKSFYKEFDNKTVWDNKTDREFILNQYANAKTEGLNPEDYNYTKLLNYESRFNGLSDSTLVNYDLFFTETAQKYISHISKGKLNPKQIYNDWDINIKEVDVNSTLFEGLKNNTLVEKIESCKPQNAVYAQLKKSLETLNSLPFDGIDSIFVKEKILPNKKSICPTIIKKRLLYWGDYTVKSPVLNTVYDKNTQDAIKHFQERHGLKPDGVIGKGTVDALNFTKNKRIEQIVVNMERWRWYDHDFGNHYLLVNIPDYHIYAVKDNDTTQKQRVVVGKETRPTPVLESKISNINLNPNWTVPPTILEEDIYPDAIKNRNTFRRKGLTILNSKNKVVSPSAWKMADAKKYHYVQNPGRNSSLGLMKINFPNKYSVYLHDTNHRELFVKSVRSLSSGCVRLEKPLELAAYILNDTTKWSLQKIKDTTDIKYYNKLIKEKEVEIEKKNAKLLLKNPSLIIPKKIFPKPQLKTIVIKVIDDIYIHQLYWTAWQEKGKLQFREDIYKLDGDLYKKLRN